MVASLDLAGEVIGLRVTDGISCMRKTPCYWVGPGGYPGRQAQRQSPALM